MSLCICMLCDSLDIGGAETHVVTLAEALVKMGHRVTVISSGGVYARSEGRLFTHIYMPLKKKRYLPLCLLRLRRLFKKERFDVIHAHTRYTAFLCRLLSRRFVSTAHWVFSTRFPYRTLSAWGVRCLAVSEDIRGYLEKEYGIEKERVTLTVNGIDTERFSAKKEEGAPYRICLASRLDGDRSRAAFLLCEALSMLGSAFRFSAVIVGDGEDMEKIKQAAEQTAKKTGASVTCVGASADVEKHLASSDIFVGVSRAALEAMASECAVILAGNEGYLSIFRPMYAEKAEKTNFCCRGEGGVTAAQLARDLSYLLSLPKDALRRMGKANRAYVIRGYSAERMAKDALSVYLTVRKEKAVLCGYYGFGNVGDTLMHLALKKRLSNEGYARIYTLSARILSLSSLYAIWQGYDFYLGGGNLLQDETSARSLGFYSFFIRYAKKRGCTVRLLSSGFGAFSPRGLAKARRVLPLIDAAECRTERDLLFAKENGVRNAKKGYDAALDICFEPKEENAEGIMLALRAPKSDEEKIEMLSFLLRLCRVFGKDRLFLFCMHPADASFLRHLSRETGIALAEGSTKGFLNALSRTYAVYAMRLHAAVCALGAGVPSFLQDGSEKNRFFIEEAEKNAHALSLPSPVRPFSLSGAITTPPNISKEAVLKVKERIRSQSTRSSM